MIKFPLIQKLHKETQKPMNVPADEKEWPNSWKIVEFKEYPRMPQIILPRPQELPKRFDETLKSRRSQRNFDLTAEFSLQKLSTLLYWSAGISQNKENPRHSSRFYPSGGGRFPLEIYLSIRKSDEIESGIYHYNVKKHILEKIHDETGNAQMRSLPTYPWAKDAAISVFITALFERNMRKYRERGYRFVHIETGALFQNFYLVSGSLGLGCCGLGSINDEAVEEILDVVLGFEYYVTRLAIGPIR